MRRKDVVSALVCVFRYKLFSAVGGCQVRGEKALHLVPWFSWTRGGRLFLVRFVVYPFSARPSSALLFGGGRLCVDLLELFASSTSVGYSGQRERRGEYLHVCMYSISQSWSLSFVFYAARAWLLEAGSESVRVTCWGVAYVTPSHGQSKVRLAGVPRSSARFVFGLRRVQPPWTHFLVTNPPSLPQHGHGSTLPCSQPCRTTAVWCTRRGHTSKASSQPELVLKPLHCGTAAKLWFQYRFDATCWRFTLISRYSIRPR